MAKTIVAVQGRSTDVECPHGQLAHSSLQSSGPPHRSINSPRFSTILSLFFERLFQPSNIFPLPASILALFLANRVQHPRPATSVFALSLSLLTHVGSPDTSALHTAEPSFSATEPHRCRRPEGHGAPNPRLSGCNDGTTPAHHGQRQCKGCLLYTSPSPRD